MMRLGRVVTGSSASRFQINKLPATTTRLRARNKRKTIRRNRAGTASHNAAGVETRMDINDSLQLEKYQLKSRPNLLRNWNSPAGAEGFGRHLQSRRCLPAFVFVDVDHPQHTFNGCRIETFR